MPSSGQPIAVGAFLKQNLLIVRNAERLFLRVCFHDDTIVISFPLFRCD